LPIPNHLETNKITFENNSQIIETNYNNEEYLKEIRNKLQENQKDNPNYKLILEVRKINSF